MGSSFQMGNISGCTSSEPALVGALTLSILDFRTSLAIRRHMLCTATHVLCCFTLRQHSLGPGQKMIAGSGHRVSCRSWVSSKTLTRLCSMLPPAVAPSVLQETQFTCLAQCLGTDILLATLKI